jgi:hypothetical protein
VTTGLAARRAAGARAAAGAAALAALLVGGAVQAEYRTPAPGTPERGDILDALRPIAEWTLGAPVEFVVDDLRVAGDVAFASLTAQRPGGGAIDLAAAPIVTRDGTEPGLIDGPRLEGLLRRSGRMWSPVEYAVGPTDVWYASPAYCAVWAAVLPEQCPGG